MTTNTTPAATATTDAAGATTVTLAGSTRAAYVHPAAYGYRSVEVMAGHGRIGDSCAMPDDKAVAYAIAWVELMAARDAEDAAAPAPVAAPAPARRPGPNMAAARRALAAAGVTRVIVHRNLVSADSAQGPEAQAQNFAAALAALDVAGIRYGLDPEWPLMADLV